MRVKRLLKDYDNYKFQCRKKHVPEIKRLFPSAKISHIPEAGHWLHVEKPIEFVSAVRNFLS